MKSKIIVALDNISSLEAEHIVSECVEIGVEWFKVGLEMYTKSGPEFIEKLKSKDVKIFLDLKLYDIPNTVAKSVAVAKDLGVDFLTIHCSGGARMLDAAQKVLTDGVSANQLSLLGVTVLTSFSNDEIVSLAKIWGATASVDRSTVAAELAKLAAGSEMSGIVCSVSDLKSKVFSQINWKQSEPFFVTPGIRQQESVTLKQSTVQLDDQRSVGTVEQAVQAGATHLVIGRPIVFPAIESRKQVILNFLKEIEDAYAIKTHP